MRHLVNLIPLPRALAELVLIVGLFLLAIVVSRLAGLLAAWLVSRRAVHAEDAPADALARLQQRETAASLTRTSVRYLAFGLALVLSIIVLSGVEHADTIAGGAFIAIVVGFAVQRVLWDDRAVGPPGRRRGGVPPLREAPLRPRRGDPRPEPPGARDAPHPARAARPRDRALRQ
jgi:hypothetical protein